MKLHIFGAAGTGVTTLGKAMANYLDVPYFDSDLYFWEATVLPYSERRAPAERNAMISRELAAVPSWVLGGSVINWGDDIFPPFDLIVFLWLPAEVRMQRVKQREYERYGALLDTDAAMQEKFQTFLAWAAGYDNNTGIGRTLEAHEAWMARQTTPVLQLRGDVSTEERMEAIMGWWRANKK
ncbi:P-loop NTPase family protein [Chitinophaga jiangningensis]|nr:adenylate kinase [Chitinophaga jiangningensis]